MSKSSSSININSLPVWEKLTLLLWKNWCVHWNNRKSLLFLILAPTIFCSILVMVRLMIDVEVAPVVEYRSVNLNEQWKVLMNTLRGRREEINETVDGFAGNPFIPNLIIGYAPNTYIAFNKTMEKVAQDYIKILPIVGFQTCEALRENMLKNNYFAGVCFNNNIMKTDHRHLLDANYPSRLNYTLFFPSELRIYHDRFIGSTWTTDTHYETFCNSEYRICGKAKEAKDGGYVGYIREGFASLQHFISMSYIRTISKNDNLPRFIMVRFPSHAHSHDRLHVNLEDKIALFLLAGFIFPVTYFTKTLIKEKQSKLRAKMKAAGISNWIHFTSWFIIGFIFMTVSSIIILMALKIHWHNGHAICTKSSWTALFFVLWSYSIVTISFCIMMSSFNSNMLGGVVMTVLVWLITFVPYVFKTSSKTTRLFMCVFSNTAMRFALKSALEYEKFGKGFHWENFLTSDTTHNIFSVGLYTLLMLVLSPIYVVIAVYVDDIKLPKFNRSNGWVSLPDSERNSSFNIKTGSAVRMTKVYEVDPEYKKLIVSIKNLTKTYGKRSVIKDISMNLYENEITVLIGHNGCGKSKLLSMLMGQEKPTSGTILINDIDMQQFPEYVRESIGTCMFNGILFNEFTVIDQLVFFSRLRGMSKTDSYFEAERFIRAMNLEKYTFTLTRNLTIGVRQQLATCCALVGNSQIVLLDEPATSTDIESRRALWELVNAEKMGRTILMSSQFVNEAEMFADRVAVMSGGELKCFGTPFFLKKFYGRGFHLNIRKTDFCNVDAITEIIGHQMPRVSPDYNIGCDLGYTIEETNINLLDEVFDKLEAQATELGLEYITISDAGLEDIFLKMGAENSNDGDHRRLLNTLSGKTIYEEEYENPAFLQNYEKITGKNLLRTHWKAMLKKRFTYILRHKFVAFLQPIIPVLFIAATCIISATQETVNLPVLRYKLTMYPSSVTVVTSLPISKRHILIDGTEENYRKQIFWLGINHKLEDTHGEQTGKYLLAKKDFLEVHQNFHVGATFGDNTLVAWFNNYPLHTVPLSLNMMHNALLRTLLDENAAIFVSLEPLSITNERKKTATQTLYSTGNFLAISVTICFGLAFSSSVTFVVEERIKGFKFMQIISGLTTCTYWLTTITVDAIRLLIISTAVSIAIAVYEIQQYGQFDAALGYFVTLMISGFCIMSYNYIMQSFFTSVLTAYSAVVVFSAMGCICYCAMYDIFTKAYFDEFHTDDMIEWPFIIFPHFSICKALVKCFYIAEMQNACNDKEIFLMSVHLEKCNSTPNCCLDFEIWNWDTGIFPELWNLSHNAVLAWTLFILLESGLINKLWFIFRKRIDYSALSSKKDHEWRHSKLKKLRTKNDIIQERIKVLTLKPREYFNKTLICNAVGKSYKNKAIITNLNLIIERSEILSLLGDNGSGKSTIIKLLVGAIKMTHGDIIIDGINITEHFDQICNNTVSHIGYCPQEDGIITDFTSEEILEILGTLRGIPPNKLNDMSRNLARMLGFYSHYHKKIQVCTNGVRKRLKCAIAMLSCPSLICLDDASSHIDPAGLRQLCLLSNLLINHGKSIIYATLLPNKVARYCTRVTLTLDGELVLLSSPPDLEAKYWSTYFLTVRIRPKNIIGNHKRYNHIDPFMKLQSLIEKEFPHSTLYAQLCDVLEFMIPKNETTTMSVVFNKMVNQLSNLNIEFMTITNSSIHSIFSRLTEEYADCKRTG